MRESRSAELDQLGRLASVGWCPAAQLDDREHALAPVGVGDADGRDVRDGGMLEQDGVHLGRVDVDAARDDEVRGPRSVR